MSCAPRRTGRILQAALVLAVIATAITVQAGAAAPQITSLSDTTLPRSGRLLIFGSSFGAAQGSSQVLIDGLDAIATTWMPTEIHAYVPEAASLGAVPVQVVTPGGSSNSMTLDVTTRQPDGRFQWRFQTDDYMPLQFVARGSDGTIYISDWVGL
ncbi:MAG: IPT/TIG domain-containing protein, partial [Planctomycetota bacterium]